MRPRRPGGADLDFQEDHVSVPEPEPCAEVIRGQDLDDLVAIPGDVRDDDRALDAVRETHEDELAAAILRGRRHHWKGGGLAHGPPPRHVRGVGETNVQRAEIRIEPRDAPHLAPEPLEPDEECRLPAAGDDDTLECGQGRNRGITCSAKSSIDRRARAFSIIPKLIWKVG